MIRRFVPVYLITGFIESGKTTLGLTVLANERFTNGGNVLILCCEEGEVEWDDKSLKDHKGILQTAAGGWFQFDYVPGEIDIREGSADYTGRLCVIGADLNEKALMELFHL